MLRTEKPYFLQNDAWYYYDGFEYKLTDKAPQKAIDSYNEWYEEASEEYDIDFETIKENLKKELADKS